VRVLTSKSHFRTRLQPFVPEAGASPLPGYKLLRLRGRGGFATVWESTSPSGKTTALKFLSSHNSNSTIRELRALRTFTTMRHANWLAIEKVWSIPGQIVIEMELAEASLLDVMLLYADDFGKPIDAKKLLMYMCDVAEGLDFLNARRHKIEGRTVGYQHGDVKPNNILLVNDTAKLADYGMATATIGTKTPCHRHGTIEYVAPEIIQGYATDSSDQFSLAVTYYLLRTTRFPFPPPPQEHELGRSFIRPGPDLSLVDGDERAALAKALSVIPQNRFPTCTAFVTALAKSLDLCSTV
jgi:serine/threonine protein kinase, bacterial